MAYSARMVFVRSTAKQPNPGEKYHMAGFTFSFTLQFHGSSDNRQIVCYQTRNQ